MYKVCKCKRRLKIFTVLFLVDSVNLWSTSLKSLEKRSFLQIVFIRPLNVVRTADMSKQVMIKLRFMEIKNMEPNIMSMFVINAVMKMTVITTLCLIY